MEWPLYSPDLNPIENIWAIMKTIIQRDHPELQNAPDNDDTLYLLIQAAKDAWSSVEERILKNLSNTMPNRVRAVIEADGWYTKYQGFLEVFVAQLLLYQEGGEDRVAVRIWGVPTHISWHCRCFGSEAVSVEATRGQEERMD